MVSHAGMETNCISHHKVSFDILYLSILLYKTIFYLEFGEEKGEELFIQP